MQVNNKSSFIASSYEETKDILSVVFSNLPPESRNSVVSVCKAFQETINFIPLNENLFNSWINSNLKLDASDSKLTLEEKILALKPQIRHMKIQNDSDKSVNQLFSNTYKNISFKEDHLVKLCNSIEAVGILENARISLDYFYKAVDEVCDMGQVKIGELLFGDPNLLLDWACRNSKVEVVKLLLKDPRVDPNVYLIEVCQRNNSEIAELFLNDPRVDPTANNNLVLYMACKNGNVKIVELLLKDLRFDPNKALNSACENGREEIVELVLKDLRVDPNEALNSACEYSRVEIVKLLLKDLRADPNIPLKEVSACIFDDEIVELLRKDPRFDPTT